MSEHSVFSPREFNNKIQRPSDEFFGVKRGQSVSQEQNLKTMSLPGVEMLRRSTQKREKAGSVVID